MPQSSDSYVSGFALTRKQARLAASKCPDLKAPSPHPGVTLVKLSEEETDIQKIKADTGAGGGSNPVCAEFEELKPKDGDFEYIAVVHRGSEETADFALHGKQGMGLDCIRWLQEKGVVHRDNVDDAARLWKTYTLEQANYANW
jgi:hypothetical protein